MSISFVYPQYLWLLIIIPFLIGLAFLSPRRTSRFRLWISIVLRTLLFLCLILSLASFQVRLRSDLLTTVFVVDASDSLLPEAQERGIEFIRSALQEMGTDDRAAIIVFGEDALVERLASEERFLGELRSIPVTTRTNISDALQLAQALFPDEGAKRLVLLSDGRENIGRAIEQATAMASNRIEISYFPLGDEPGGAEVFVEYLESPPEVRQGESFVVNASIYSSTESGATMRLFGDGNLIQTRETLLAAGYTRIPFEIKWDELKKTISNHNRLYRFKLQVLPDVDFRLQNNEGNTFTIFHGPPNILIVEGHTGDGLNISQALESAEMNVDSVLPEELPTSIADLANFQAIILVNTPSDSLPIGTMELLQVFVRDLGMGLIMVGGPDSFGAGGYLRSPVEETLPVSMDIKNRQMQANLALVLAVDKSGSMGRCHCDNPDLNQTYTRAEVGQSKVDIAKEAIMRAANALGDQDYLGVVAFDGSAHWAVRVMPRMEPLELENAISRILPEGSTNMETGVMAAFNALEGVQAQRKHIILLTDGWVRQGDLTDLVEEMQSRGITLSVIAAGEGSAEYLKNLAGIGGGRFYPAANMLSVPDIFLQETIESVGEYVIEEAFYPIPAVPSPMLRDVPIQEFPPLLGYNGTTSKSTGRLDLITPRGDPLLASWQYGLGRSAAWTSDFRGQWAKNWLEKEEISTFITQMVDWVLPAPKVEGLEATAQYLENEAIVQLKAVDKSGEPVSFLDIQASIIDPELHSQDLVFRQISAGLYQAKKTVSVPGIYLVRLGVNQGDQSLGQYTLGVVVPYSPEYKTTGTDKSFLDALAHITGGQQVTDPEFSFTHNLAADMSSRPIWYALLLIVALLFPVDVAVRRLNLNVRELKLIANSSRSRFARRRQEIQIRSRLMQSLFQARDRARDRQTYLRNQPQELSPEIENKGSKEDQIQVGDPDSENSGNEHLDHLSRLKEAKNRAQRRLK